MKQKLVEKESVLYEKIATWINSVLYLGFLGLSLVCSFICRRCCSSS